MIGLEQNIVVLCDEKYDYWNKLFLDEKFRLESALKGYSYQIEHVGSTSVLGLIAKPIIDIAVGLKKEYMKEETIEMLKAYGYEYQSEHGDIGRLLFIKVEGKKCTHHIHVEKYGSIYWNNHILFRNCLRKDANVRENYAKLKRNIAQLYPYERQKYTAAKASFIVNTVEKYKIDIMSQ